MVGAKRWVGSVAVLVLAAGGCADGAAQVSAGQAKNSACLHASGAVVSASGSEEPEWGPLIDALEIDRDLLTDAGDDSTARTVDEVIEDLRSGVMQPLEISLYLRDEISETQIEQISAGLEEEPDVASQEYISSQRAYEEFVEIYEDQPEFYENMPADALPASFRVRTVEGADPDAVVSRLQELEGVDEVRSSDGVFRKLAPLRPLLKLCDVPVPGESP